MHRGRVLFHAWYGFFTYQLGIGRVTLSLHAWNAGRVIGSMHRGRVLFHAW